MITYFFFLFCYQAEAKPKELKRLEPNSCPIRIDRVNKSKVEFGKKERNSLDPVAKAYHQQLSTKG